MRNDTFNPAASNLVGALCLRTASGRLTVDPQFSIAQAVAIREGKFLAVGSNTQIEAFTGPNTVRVDLSGRTVLPGLMDTHAHVASVGVQDITVSLANVTTVAQVLEQIRAWAAKSKPGDWIIGSSWHPLSQLQERRYLTRWEIDHAAPDNPVFLSVGHFAMTNSMALARAGINKGTADPPGGVVERERGGEPNGVLEESAIELLTAKMPVPTITGVGPITIDPNR